MKRVKSFVGRGIAAASAVCFSAGAAMATEPTGVTLPSLDGVISNVNDGGTTVLGLVVAVTGLFVLFRIFKKS
jgi:hypothetical protein